MKDMFWKKEKNNGGLFNESYEKIMDNCNREIRDMIKDYKKSGDINDLLHLDSKILDVKLKANNKISDLFASMLNNFSAPLYTEDTIQETSSNIEYTRKKLEAMHQRDREMANLMIYGNKDGPEKDKYSNKQ